MTAARQTMRLGEALSDLIEELANLGSRHTTSRVWENASSRVTNESPSRAQ